MTQLLFTGARVVPVTGDPIDDCDVLIANGRIEAVGHGLPKPPGARTIDAKGHILMPAFTDCHTHTCWAGERLDEWDRKRAGEGYLEILAAGGGIMSTVRAVRDASRATLTDLIIERLEWMLWEGTTAVEIKSGYGLTTRDELKMLGAIADAADRWPGRVRATACIGHALDPDVPRDRFVRTTVDETLDAVHEQFPDAAIDAYCEEGAWSLAECTDLFTRAQDLGHPCRVHTDQFHELGMTDLAIERGFVSVDHLEASSERTLDRVGGSATCAVSLPCSGFHVDDRYADARRILDSGGRVALATNLNPGSAPTCSMPMAIALGVRRCGLSPAEAIRGATREGARVLGYDDLGRIEPGAAGDLVLLRHRDERELAHTFGGSPVAGVVCAGELIRLDRGWTATQAT